MSWCILVCIGPSGVGKTQEAEITPAISVTPTLERVVPILLPNANPTLIPPLLRGRVYVDLRGGLADEVALGRLVSAITVRKKAQAPDDPLIAMNNLAETLRTEGDLDQARKLQEEVLAIRRREMGLEHPDTLTSMNNLAGTLSAQGD